MTKKQKILELKRKLEEIKFERADTNVAVRRYLSDDETIRVKERPINAAVQRIADDLNKVQKDPRLEKLIGAVKKTRDQGNTRLGELEATFSEKSEAILGEIRAAEARGYQMTASEIEALYSQFQANEEVYRLDKQDQINRTAVIDAEVAKIAQELRSLSPSLEASFRSELAIAGARIETVYGEVGVTRETVTGLSEKIVSLEKDLLRALEKAANTGGGNMNRQVLIAGNSSTLGQYTDINLIPSSNMSITPVVDNVNHRTDFYFSATGGGSGTSDWLTVKEVDGNPTVGSVTTIRVSNGTLTDDGGGQVTISTGGGGTGITRSVSVISVDTNAGATANTDYVYFPNVGIRFNLPSVVGNTNLYTVKNFSNSSVLVTAAEGIDGSATALMVNESPLFASRSFISNGSIWGVV